MADPLPPSTGRSTFITEPFSYDLGIVISRGGDAAGQGGDVIGGDHNAPNIDIVLTPNRSYLVTAVRRGDAGFTLPRDEARKENNDDINVERVRRVEVRDDDGLAGNLFTIHHDHDATSYVLTPLCEDVECFRRGTTEIEADVSPFVDPLPVFPTMCFRVGALLFDLVACRVLRPGNDEHPELVSTEPCRLSDEYAPLDLFVAADGTRVSRKGVRFVPLRGFEWGSDDTANADALELPNGQRAFGKLLGEGAYGQVQEIKIKLGETVVRACGKVIGVDQWRKHPSRFVGDHLCREIAVLSEVNQETNMSEFFVKWFGAFMSFSGVVLVMELCMCDFESVISRTEGNTLAMNAGNLAMVEDFAHSVFSGLAFLHARGICHSDLTPRNILVQISKLPHVEGAGDHDSNLRDPTKPIYKLSDFGCASLKQAGNRGFDMVRVITTEYQAPERFPLFKSMSFEIDVWAAGLIILQWIAGKHPFPERLVEFSNARPRRRREELSEADGEAVQDLLRSQRKSARMVDPDADEAVVQLHPDIEFTTIKDQVISLCPKNVAFPTSGTPIVHVLVDMLNTDPSERPTSAQALDSFTGGGGIVDRRAMALEALNHLLFPQP